jgi:hypothetical protein
MVLREGKIALLLLLCRTWRSPLGACIVTLLPIVLHHGLSWRRHHDVTSYSRQKNPCQRVASRQPRLELEVRQLNPSETLVWLPYFVWWHILQAPQDLSKRLHRQFTRRRRLVFFWRNSLPRRSQLVVENDGRSSSNGMGISISTLRNVSTYQSGTWRQVHY